MMSQSHIRLRCKVSIFHLASASLTSSFHLAFYSARVAVIQKTSLNPPDRALSLESPCNLCQQRCRNVFCVDCDDYIHISLHNCPGCESVPASALPPMEGTEPSASPSPPPAASAGKDGKDAKSAGTATASSASSTSGRTAMDLSSDSTHSAAQRTAGARSLQPSNSTVSATAGGGARSSGSSSSTVSGPVPMMH